MGNFSDLPNAIHLINLSNPKGKEEKVWSKVLERFEQGMGEKLFLESLEKITGIINLSDAYIIQDVIITRTYLSLILMEYGIKKEYKISTTAYSFLTNLNPSQPIIITRHVDDGDIYVEWPSLGYMIKLTAFSCNDL